MQYGRKHQRWRESCARAHVLPMREALGIYVQRLLARYGLDKDLFILALVLAPGPERNKFGSFVKRHAIEGKGYRIEFDAWGGNSPETQIAENIIGRLQNSQLRLTGSRIAREMGELLHRTMPSGTIPPHRRLNELQRVLVLSAEQVEILRFFYCIAAVSFLSDFWTGKHEMVRIGIISSATNLPLARVRREISYNARLRTAGLLRFPADCKGYTHMDDEVMEYLSGMRRGGIADAYCKPWQGRVLKLDSFSVPPDVSRTVRIILEAGKPCNILLYGKAGTGKTEYAKAIAASTGLKAWFVGFPRLTMADGRMFAIQIAKGTLPPRAGVIVVDEADDFLNTQLLQCGSHRAVDKGRVNELLDSSEHRIIWITNETSMIEESTLRRFTYSVKFSAPSQRQRESSWRAIARRHAMTRKLGNGLLREMAARYKATPAGITSALTSLKMLESKIKPDQMRAMLKDLVERHMEAIGERSGGRIAGITSNYDPAALNMDVDPGRLIASVRCYAKVAADRSIDEPGSMNLLFWGKPGTGKTEFAKYLAEDTGLELSVKRASDLLSMWVGGTEANISTAFAEAEQKNAILLIDEADSMFINREGADHSWEVSQTNELLTQMENHRGILICCTNMKEHLDNAVARRFAWKVGFRPLTHEGKVHLCYGYFPDSMSRADIAHIEALAAIRELTAGDIKAVFQKLRYATFEPLSPDTLIETLSAEVAYREQTAKEIGFACK